jgi:hypothetical protein
MRKKSVKKLFLKKIMILIKSQSKKKKACSIVVKFWEDDEEKSTPKIVPPKKEVPVEEKENCDALRKIYLSHQKLAEPEVKKPVTEAAPVEIKKEPEVSKPEAPKLIMQNHCLPETDPNYFDLMLEKIGF